MFKVYRPGDTAPDVCAFRLGDVIIWETQWRTKYLGQVKALFLDNRNVESLYAICIDADLSSCGFHFIAAASSCKLFIGKLPTPIEGEFSVETPSS